MKKITLLMTALLWSSLFYGQTYVDEGFESGIPGTWVVETTSGSAWASSTVTANSGSNSAHNADAASPTASVSWLISPSFDLTSGTSPELTYYEAVDFPDFPANIEVYYILGYSGSGVPTGEVLITDVFDFTNLDPLDPNSGEGSPNHIWKFRGAFDLSAANGQSDVRIAFKYDGTLKSEWYLDDIKVRETNLSGTNFWEFFKCNV